MALVSIHSTIPHLWNEPPTWKEQLLVLKMQRGIRQAKSVLSGREHSAGRVCIQLLSILHNGINPRAVLQPHAGGSCTADG